MIKNALNLIIISCLVACSLQPRVVEIRGQTMGTTYSVKLPRAPESVEAEPLKAEIDALLAQVNAQMSTYDPDSDLSRLNKAPAGEWVGIPPELMQVLLAARQVFELSDGRFDPTVGPLVNLWGFGPGVEVDFPDEVKVQKALARVGFSRHLSLDTDNHRVRKDHPAVYVDLSAIAKGYAVDVVADMLAAREITDYMVEIGGEIRVAGNNPANKPWRLAVESPTPGQRKIHGVVAVNEMAIATSGDYRNFFEHEGRRYSHSIDPLTGYPVAHKMVSATVLHASAMQADALATTMMVLGPEAGLELAKAQGLAVWLIAVDGEDFRDIYSPEMQAYRVH